MLDGTNQKRYKKLIITFSIWILYFIWLLKIGSTSLTVSNFVLHLMFLFLLVYIYRDDLSKNLLELKSDKKKNILKLLLYFLLFIGALIIGNIIVTILLNGIEVDSSNSALYTLFSKVPFGTLFVCFLTIVFYPVVEELVFRKSLRDVITNSYLFVIISSLFTWYFQVTIINPTMPELITAIPTFVFSLYLSILYVKKGNILYTIFPRMFYNILICAIQLFSIL